ncbi:MAG: pilus assembly protein N-terminal domain-containing protein [Bacteriovorax sp.]|nr:pilus assembly protein N-terminal domain-containing protein [Bacteriovorax sp.]
MLNKFCSLIIFCLLSLSLIAQDDVSKDEALKEVDVVVGLEKIIKLDFVPNSVVKLANENLASYQIVPSKKQVLLTGLKAGETTLTLRDTAGDIRARYLVKVTASDQSKVVVQLKELLNDVEGLEIGIKGDAVYVGGQIVVPSDIGKVVVILDKYPDVLRLVELSPQTQLIIARKMQEEIQKSNFKDVTVRVVNGSFWIEGVVGSEEDIKRVEQIVNAYLPDQIQNLARRTDAVQSIKKRPYEILLTFNSKPKQEPLPKLFKITAQFVELTKGYDRLFSFQWTPVIGGTGGEIGIGKSNSGGVTTSSSGALAATISHLFPKLDSAKSAGHARVVESGVVVVKENIAGSIKKTTTIPYQIGTADNAKAGSAVAGFDMNITPTMLQEEKINLKIVIHVSSASNDAPPRTLDNTVDTQIIVKSQESAVIGGVVTNNTSTDFDKVDPLAITDGTPLFSFVKSKKYSTSRTQFVMFVTPELIESAATGASDIERKFRKRSR